MFEKNGFLLELKILGLASIFRCLILGEAARMLSEVHRFLRLSSGSGLRGSVKSLD